MKEKKQFIIRLSSDLFVRLRKESYESGTSANRIIIDLLDKHLPKKEKIHLKSKDKVIS